MQAESLSSDFEGNGSLAAAPKDVAIEDEDYHSACQDDHVASSEGIDVVPATVGEQQTTMVVPKDTVVHSASVEEEAVSNKGDDDDEDQGTTELGESCNMANTVVCVADLMDDIDDASEDSVGGSTHGEAIQATATPLAEQEPSPDISNDGTPQDHAALTNQLTTNPSNNDHHHLPVSTTQQKGPPSSSSREVATTGKLRFQVHSVDDQRDEPTEKLTDDDSSSMGFASDVPRVIYIRTTITGSMTTAALETSNEADMTTASPRKIRPVFARLLRPLFSRKKVFLDENDVECYRKTLVSL